MNSNRMPTSLASIDANFGALLEVLGYHDGETITVCWRRPHGPFLHTFTGHGDACTEAARYAEDSDVYFSVNPICEPAGGGRGGEQHVMRCTALYVDIDLKAAGVPDGSTAEAIVDVLSAAVGQRPVAVVSTGNGWHIYWKLDDGPEWLLDTDAKRSAAIAVYRRFHRLAAHIAAAHGCRVDNIGQLSRVLRIPGSLNRKQSDAPVPVELCVDPPYGGGGPLSFAEVTAALDEYGVPEIADDRTMLGTVVSDPGQWAFGTRTTAYVAAMVRGWRSDRPASRHGWFVSQSVRLACAHRVGRISESDHTDAVTVLTECFARMLARYGTPRQVTPGEVDDALAWGVRKAASLTAEQAAAECGGQDDSHGPEDGVTTAAAVPDGKPKLWLASDMAPARPLEWLAKGNVPKAAVTLLVGDEGIGKSTYWVWMVAHITTGKACLEYGLPPRDPQDVVLVVTEDDWSSTVGPRLQTAGADLHRVHVFAAEKDGSGSPMLPDHLDILVGSEIKPALMVVDAWLDTVPPSLSVKDPQHARQALHPMKEYATATGAAVLLLTHTNRVATANARDKYGATAELRKTARQTLFALADPDNDDCLIIGPEKSNNVARGVEATRFRIVPVQVADSTDDSDGVVTKVEYVGPAGKSTRDLIADAFHGFGDDDDDDKLGEALDWLADYLAKNGTTASKLVKDDARAAGIAVRTLERAAGQLPVQKSSVGYPRTTHWGPTGGVEMVSGDFQDVDGPGIEQFGADIADRIDGLIRDHGGADGLSKTQIAQYAVRHRICTAIEASQAITALHAAARIVNTGSRKRTRWMPCGQHTRSGEKVDMSDGHATNP